MTTNETGPAPEVLDQDLLLAEIYAEVERRRATGELPAGLEAELDRAFAELAPAGGAGDDEALVLERVQRASFIEPRVPLEDLRPPKSQVKRVLFKLMAWYVHFVTDQVTAFGGAVTTALRHHDRRIAALEEGGAELPAHLRAELDRVPERPVPVGLRQALIEVLAPVDGRVLVAESGDGSLLTELRRSGIDAYGAEPRRSRLPAALRNGLEVRAMTGAGHLRQLPDSRLAAVVLTGSAVERTMPAGLAELAALAARVVVPGGLVAVVSPSPEAWLSLDAGPAADLSPGHPLRPATWSQLLTSAGLEVLATVAAEPVRPLPAVDADTPGAGALAELVQRLAPLLAPSPGYLVTARRPW